MVDNKKINQILLPLMLILFASMAAGLFFQSLLQIGNFWNGFFASALLTLIIGIALFFAWRAAGRGKALAWMIFLAFILRFALGVFLAWGLPRFGYPERPQQAGFVFEDAFRRERNAWDLAQSGEPITDAFGDVYETDQYGGMLAFSALIYRVLSSDAFRPALISIITAGVMALSVPVLYSALHRKFSPKTVLWACWILAIYPEGILLGSAQMREPFFILNIVLLIWVVTQILDKRKFGVALPVLFLSAASLFAFSFRVALPVIGMFLFWIWVDLSGKIKQSWIKALGWGLILLGTFGALWLMRYWVDAVLHWDTLQTVRRSGMVQRILNSLPDWADFPFVLVYGFFQPVLPAAIAAPAPWIWRAMGIFRALGWYALLPLLAYAGARVWKLEPSRKKRWLAPIILMVWAWVFIASARAGGDQWDNPRYRTIFLPWMALVAGWAIQFARKTRDAWLARILIVEGVFLAVFTIWYLGRYTPAFRPLSLVVMVVLIVVSSGLILGLGWLRENRRSKQIDDEAAHQEG